MPAGVRPAASESRRGGADSSASFAAGVVVGERFVLEARLHAGATAEVWRARERNAGAPVAVKLATTSGAGGRDARRLRAEYDWLRSLDHFAIPAPLAFAADETHVALVTEYFGGGDLVSLRGAAPRHWAAPAAAVAAALAYLHEQGLAHRDVKARNVMLDTTGRAHLIDWGSAARFGSARHAAGTTAEHRLVNAGRVDAADDIHAFAVLVYELISGRLPFGPGPRNGARIAALPREGAPSAPLERLEALVLETLAARGPVSIRTYRDVIESMALKSESS